MVLKPYSRGSFLWSALGPVVRVRAVVAEAVVAALAGVVGLGLRGLSGSTVDAGLTAGNVVETVGTQVVSLAHGEFAEAVPTEGRVPGGFPVVLPNDGTDQVVLPVRSAEEVLTVVLVEATQCFAGRRGLEPQVLRTEIESFEVDRAAERGFAQGRDQFRVDALVAQQLLRLVELVESLGLSLGHGVRRVLAHARADHDRACQLDLVVVGAVVTLQTLEHHCHDRRSESLEQLLAQLEVFQAGVAAAELRGHLRHVVELLHLLAIDSSLQVQLVALGRCRFPKEQQVGLVVEDQVVARETRDDVRPELDRVVGGRLHGDGSLRAAEAVREVQSATGEVRYPDQSAVQGALGARQRAQRRATEQAMHLLTHCFDGFREVRPGPLRVHGGVGGAGGALGGCHIAQVLLVVGDDALLQLRDGAVELGDLRVQRALLVAQPDGFLL